MGMGNAKTIRELELMPRKKLVEEHDNHAPDTIVGVDYYLAEIRRRDSASREKAMVNLTWAIAGMTAVVTVATIVNLLVFLSGG